MMPQPRVSSDTNLGPKPHDTLFLENGHSWPRNSRYFISQIMDDSAALALIRDNTKFDVSPTEGHPLQCLDVTSNGSFSTNIDAKNLRSVSAFGMSDLPDNSLRVLFVEQRRRYLDNSTHVDNPLPLSTWKGILNTCMIPPAAVELMYENNGGCFQHISYCNDNPACPCETAFAETTPCAYHACFKQCVWTFEHFIYARYDFHSRKTFVMVTGSPCDAQVDQLLSQFSDQRNIELHAVLQALACVWAQEVEQERWKLDFATQTFESLTGAASMRFHGSKPLPREKLRLRTDMIATQDSLRITSTASSHTGELFRFIQDSLWRFHDLCFKHDRDQISERRHQLSDSLEMRINQQYRQTAQIANLTRRMEAQWDVVNAMISHYNNELNIGMARDSRTDSVMMRRISFVTIVFLPATFMATFFSMGFFQVGDSDWGLSVSRWIWLYFVSTTLLTVLLAWQYAPSTRLLRKLTGLIGRKRSDEAVEPDVEKIG